MTVLKKGVLAGVAAVFAVSLAAGVLPASAYGPGQGMKGEGRFMQERRDTDERAWRHDPASSAGIRRAGRGAGMIGGGPGLGGMFLGGMVQGLTDEERAAMDDRRRAFAAAHLDLLQQTGRDYAAMVRGVEVDREALRSAMIRRERLWYAEVGDMLSSLSAERRSELLEQCGSHPYRRDDSPRFVTALDEAAGTLELSPQQQEQLADLRSGADLGAAVDALRERRTATMQTLLQDPTGGARLDELAAGNADALLTVTEYGRQWRERLPEILTLDQWRKLAVLRGGHRRGPGMQAGPRQRDGGPGETAPGQGMRRGQGKHSW
ncbi:MAG: hypothetical protein K9L28_03235 [Synergistales bacterium]|nr:hypothetical protein [Synergistales bacterium]